MQTLPRSPEINRYFVKESRLDPKHNIFDKNQEDKYLLIKQVHIFPKFAPFMFYEHYYYPYQTKLFLKQLIFLPAQIVHSHADLTAGVVATNKIIGESFALCFHIGFWLGPGWAWDGSLLSFFLVWGLLRQSPVCSQLSQLCASISR